MRFTRGLYAQSQLLIFAIVANSCYSDIDERELRAKPVMQSLVGRIAMVASREASQWRGASELQKATGGAIQLSSLVTRYPEDFSSARGLVQEMLEGDPWKESYWIRFKIQQNKIVEIELISGGRNRQFNGGSVDDITSSAKAIGALPDEITSSR